MSSTDPNPPRRSPADPSQPRRPTRLELFSTSEEDIHSLPSPPYRPTPSASNLYLNAYPEASPAYRSTSRLDLITESSAMVDAKHEVRDRASDGDDHHPKASAKTARFPDDIPSPAHSVPQFKRVDSDVDFTRSGSRSPSIADTDDEIDDYDWEAEEDLVDMEAKFEQSIGTNKRSWGFRRILALAFGSLVGSTLISGLIVLPALIVRFYWYKPHPTDHRRYVKDNVEAWLFWAAANLIISWYLALIIDVVPVVANYLLAIVWGHVSESVKTKTELYNSVKDTIKPLFYASSAWASWVIIFEGIYGLYNMGDNSKSRAPYTNRLFDVVEFVFFLALVVCAQQMLSHAIAFAFHRTAYRERLGDVTKTLKVVEKLRAYKPKRHTKNHSQGFGSRSFNALNLATNFLPYSRPGTPVNGRSRQPTPDHSRSASPSPMDRGTGRHNTDDTEDLDATLVGKDKGKNKVKHGFFIHSPERADSEPVTSPHQFSDRPGSPHVYPPRHTHKEDDTPDVRDVNVKDVRQAAKTVAKTVKTAVLHDARNLSGRTDTDISGLMWDVSSSHEAKRLARSIYTVFRSPARTYLVPSDFYPAFATNDEAAEAFRVFDTDNNGDITRAEIKTTLLKVYKERRFLSRSMRDVGVALQSLDQILMFFALVVLFFISLSVFGVSVGSSLTSLYSLGIALSFIFKNAASGAFDAIMFLFVTHPFDTGDRCFIDDENLVVKKMGLFATVFTRQDGSESYYFNSQLFNKFIINARRSDKTAELCSLSIDWKTPLEKLDELEKCLNDWLAKEKNRWFQPSTGVAVQKITNMRWLEITIGIPHNAYELADWGVRLARKTAFHAAVQHYTRQLGITAYEPTIPVVYTDPETQELLSYPGEDEFVDVGYDQDASSQNSQLPPGAHAEGGATKPAMTTLGFELPPDGPGIRARKSRGRKVGMQPLGADG